jgi:hypothetical protein
MNDSVDTQSLSTWEPVDASIWCAESELRMGPGLWIPLCSTLIKLQSGSLWLHSPIPFEDGVVAETEALGTVETLVAPSGFHHLHMAKAKALFPEAHIISSPVNARKQPTLKVDHWLNDAPLPSWCEEIEAIAIDGMPKIQEWAFYHKSSETLILTDLVFNMLEPKGWLTPLVYRLFGTYRRLGQSRLFRSFIKDRNAYNASIENLLNRPIKRIIPAHGARIEGQDTHAQLTRVLT